MLRGPRRALLGFPPFFARIRNAVVAGASSPRAGHNRAGKREQVVGIGIGPIKVAEARQQQTSRQRRWRQLPKANPTIAAQSSPQSRPQHGRRRTCLGMGKQAPNIRRFAAPASGPRPQHRGRRGGNGRCKQVRGRWIPCWPPRESKGRRHRQVALGKWQRKGTGTVIRKRLAKGPCRDGSRAWPDAPRVESSSSIPCGGQQPMPRPLASASKCGGPVLPQGGRRDNFIELTLAQ